MPSTVSVLTENGSEFKMTDVGGGVVEIERMSVTSTRFVPFVTANSVSDIVEGRSVKGTTVDGDEWTTSKVVSVKRDIGG